MAKGRWKCVQYQIGFVFEKTQAAVLFLLLKALMLMPDDFILQLFLHTCTKGRYRKRIIAMFPRARLFKARLS